MTKIINKKNNGLHSGILSHLIINTGQQQFPTYLSSYLDHLTIRSEGVFDPLQLQEIADKDLIPASAFNDGRVIEAKDNIYQITFQLCVELPLKDYIEYLDTLFMGDLNKFLRGCQISYGTVFHTSSLNATHRGILTIGSSDRSLFIAEPKNQELIDMIAMLLDLPFSELYLDDESVGVIELSNCITPENEIPIENFMLIQELNPEIV